MWENKDNKGEHPLISLKVVIVHSLQVKFAPFQTEQVCPKCFPDKLAKNLAGTTKAARIN